MRLVKTQMGFVIIENPEIVVSRRGDLMVLSPIHATQAVLCTPSRAMYLPTFTHLSFYYLVRSCTATFDAYMLDTTTTSFLPPHITSPSFYLPSSTSVNLSLTLILPPSPIPILLQHPPSLPN